MLNLVHILFYGLLIGLEPITDWTTTNHSTN